MKRLLTVLVALLLAMLVLPSFAVAYDIEGTIEKSMTDSLLSAGLDEITSLRIARQYMFIGTVMIGKTQLSTASEGDALFTEAEEIGLALGRALAGAKLVYGDSKLEEIAWVMMKSVRAGVPADMAAGTFVALAGNSYTFDAAVSVLDRVAEVVRSIRMQDAGKALCYRIQSLAGDNVSVGAIEKEILVTVRTEKNKQARILAKKEAERLKRDNAGGGSEGRGGRGDSVAAAGGNDNANSGRGNANEASSSANDNSSASDTSSANDNSSADDSSAADDSASGDDSANDSSSAGNESSGENDSSSDGSGGDDSANGDDGANDSSSEDGGDTDSSTIQ